MADLAPLPLLVSMGDPWISGLLCVWTGSGHWSRVETFNIIHSGVPLCLALVGFLLLAVVGGQIEPWALGVPMCICGGGVLVWSVCEVWWALGYLGRAGI